jgi:hypothetical protein
MTKEMERNTYQLVAIVCFFAFIFIGHKYNNLRLAYQKAETDKVYYCKEYHKAKCSIEMFLDAEANQGNKE